MEYVCRECDWFGTEPCPDHTRLISRENLFSLSLAHIDCDAFYASVEKRDNPSLTDKPVIIGGRDNRSVVATACYVARRFGVKSAMPMGQALALCPQAVVLRPDFEKYRATSFAIREKMNDLTPLVEAVSLDEAYLDLTGVARLHRAPPAALLARLAREVKRDVGVSISVGLSFSPSFAKMASDMDKPDGFFVLTQSDVTDVLSSYPVSIISGVGSKAQAVLARAGISTFEHLRTADLKWLSRELGSFAFSIVNLANGIDGRKVTPNAPAKSVSNETTFSKDISSKDVLKAEIWPLCEKVSHRLKEKDVVGRTLVLKLKTSDHKNISRRRQVPPTHLAEDLYQGGCQMIDAAPRGRYRLVGIGMSDLSDHKSTPMQSTLFETNKVEKAERAMDEIRQKWGAQAIFKGRNLDKK